MKLRYLLGFGITFFALYNRVRLLFANNAIQGYVRVLMYHNIPENKLTLFQFQIQYLASNYQFLTPLQFQEFVKGRYQITGVNLLVTFDDGFKSNCVVAEKILEPLGIKGIFFVPTEFISLPDINKQKKFIINQIYDGDTNNPEISPDMKPLTWNDLEYLLGKGHTVGSHTKNHKRLSNLYSKDELYNEIVESGNILEEKLGIPSTYFAYPFGDIGSINKQAFNVIKTQYQYCFSGVRGANYYPTSDYAILRDSVSIDDPPRYVRFIIENGLDILYRKKARRLLELAEESADCAD